MKVHLLLVMIFVLSCDTSKDSQIVRESDNLEEVRHQLTRYSMLNCHCDIVADESSFIFLKEQRWDTSFLLVMKKTERGAAGLYHEITPLNAESGYIVGAEFFDGYRFEIDSTVWNDLINKSSLVLETVDPFSGPCQDCGFYFMTYNGRFTYTKGNDQNSERFEEYVNFLRGKVLAPIARKKLKVQKAVGDTK